MPIRIQSLRSIRTTNDYTKGIKRLHNENLVNPERIHGNPWIKRSQRDGCVEDYFASLVKEKTKLPLEMHRFREQQTIPRAAPVNVICNQMSKILEQENKKTRLAGSQWRIPRSL